MEQPQSGVVSLDSQAVRRCGPHSYPFILLDRVKYDAEAKTLTALKNVSQNDPFIQGHFPEHPIFPGALVVEALAQASAMLAALEYLAARGTPVDKLRDEAFSATVGFPVMFLVESKIKQMGPVYPGDQMTLHAQLLLKREPMWTFRVSASVEHAEMAKGQIMHAFTGGHYFPGKR